ncbi:MAG TPA: nucleotide exchange factor GrpE [Gammaproteobacteria bacterium]
MAEKTAADKKDEARHAGEEAPAVPQQSGQETQAPPVEEEAAEASEAHADLTAALNEALAKAEENWNQYLRAVAELENIRKRASRDVEQARRFALERFAADLLPVKDSLEMGLDAASDAQDKAGALVEGTEMTLKQLAQAFEKFGITEIEPKGERFDPEMHEAMATQPSSDAEPGRVLTVVQKGYLLNGRVLRAARVLVARQPDEE